jgi:Ca2+-binding RTX toxin-like protein
MNGSGDGTSRAKTPREQALQRGITAIAVACAMGAAAHPAAATVAGYGDTGSQHQHTLFVNGDEALDRVHVSVRRDGRTVSVRDTGDDGVSPGRGCRRGSGSLTVLCSVPSTQSRRLVIQLGSGADEARVYSAARRVFVTEIWGESGDDKLAVEEGARPAYLLGGADHDTLFGSSSGREALWGGPGDDGIVPGGGRDHIDGGHGAFTRSGRPVFMAYDRERATAPWNHPDGRPSGYTDCDRHSGGFSDRYHDVHEENIYNHSFTGPGYSTGTDTLFLQNSPVGVLVDLDVCRLGYFGTDEVSLLHAIENVHGSQHNDRLVSSAEFNVLIGNSGQDWIAGAGRADAILARDGEVDTILCQNGSWSPDWELDEVVENGTVTRYGERLENCG